MSSNKKDLTRIEDLGEYIHELNADDELGSGNEFPSDLPDLPESEDDNLFAFNEPQGLDFGTTEEFPETTFDANNEDAFSSDFSGTEETTPLTDSLEFSSSEEFGTTDFGTSFTEEEPQIETDSYLTDSEESHESEALNASELLVSEETLPAIDRAPVQEMTSFHEEREYKAPETFEDLKKFSENTSFGAMTTEGNPSFSVLLKNVRYIEDIQDIILLLKELNLLVDSEEQTKSRLMRGMLLIPRISEFAAIFLSHKLRRFDIDILVGPSDEIHPPKHQEAPETGIVSKHNLYQNQTHHFHFDDPKLEMSQIIVSATSSLEGYQVVKYLGVASEHKMLEGHVVEDENSSEVPRHYQELAQKLKAHALKANSNAVVGLNYQLTPIPGEFGMGGHKYRLTCTGNLVWVNKL